MPRIDGTTNAQTTFLRAFRNNPAGPPPDQWPAPAVLRRWLRRPCFQRALTTLREVLRFRADFHLTAAATQAARQLAQPDSAITAPDYKRLLDLIRLSHLRQRFPAEDPDLVIPSHWDEFGERLYRDEEFTDAMDDDNFVSPPKPAKQGIGRP
ncbi:MAG: hypothetical protein JWN40_1664 [Phycisphaerales bacterium]|nr:hypothetical protein [Phycisphaerales bacterium]